MDKPEKYMREAVAVSNYQFRAPAEWFAEIFAYHYMGVLEGHPLEQWIADLVRRQEAIDPTPYWEKAAHDPSAEWAAKNRAAAARAGR